MIWDEPAGFQDGPGNAPVHLWTIPDENESALGGAGSVGETWVSELIATLGSCDWGGFALLSGDDVDRWTKAWPVGSDATVWLMDDDVEGLPVKAGGYLEGWADGRTIAILKGTGSIPALLSKPAAPSASGTESLDRPLSTSSEVIGRTDSVAIRLASIDVVERLAKQLEDATESPTEKAIAHTIVTHMDVLRAHVRGEPVDKDQIDVIAENLHHLATEIVRRVPSGLLVQLGREILERLPEIVG